MKNPAISTATMVDPTGVPRSIETRIPKTVHSIEKTTAHIVTALKLLNTRIAESAGKIIKADMSSAPTRFIARTMITAITIDRVRLYILTFTPVATAKSSSKVIAKILL